MNYLPLPIVLFFLLTVLATLIAFGNAVRWSRAALAVCVVWIVIQSVVALSGFYLATHTLPPHLAMAIVPPLVVIAGLFVTAAGRRFIDGMELKWCVLLHTVRILVEANLYWLFLYKQMPALMTFEAGNLDILVGISAPVIWWLYRNGRVGRTGLLVWNGLSLVSALNAVARALLSAPFSFQRFGFDQPTVAILHFPFVLLPAFIVPVAILCHLAAFRKLSGPVRDDV
jgi:hypothetical protein